MITKILREEKRFIYGLINFEKVSFVIARSWAQNIYEKEIRNETGLFKLNYLK